MTRSSTFLIITLLFISVGWSQNDKTTISDINHFLKDLTVLTLPFYTTSLSNGKKVSTDYFYFEKDNSYYELEGLKCFGYFKKENIIYLLYGFNLVGEGEGFASDMIILSSFYKTGKHIEDIELQGSYGGEGGAAIYEKAVIDEKTILVDLRDEHYESDTGLGTTIIEYKKNIYNFDGKYNLTEKTFRCDKLNAIEEYYQYLKKGYEDKNDAMYGLSYRLENYMHCFPVAKNNITTYKGIWNYLKKSVDIQSVILLSEEIKKIEVADNLILISVDNLRLRNASGLKAKTIELLPINSEVIYLEEKSKYKQEVNLNDRKIVDYWYKVKTKNGSIGWLHGCCVNFL